MIAPGGEGEGLGLDGGHGHWRAGVLGGVFHAGGVAEVGGDGGQGDAGAGLGGAEFGFGGTQGADEGRLAGGGGVFVVGRAVKAVDGVGGFVRGEGGGVELG